MASVMGGRAAVRVPSRSPRAGSTPASRRPSTHVARNFFKNLSESWQSSDDDTSRFSQKARDDMYKQQQEILASRRKNKGGGLSEEVKARRAAASAAMRSKAKSKTKIDKDYYKKRGEEKSNSIPIPMASFGMPEFDGGERFDLKGPYCDEGYEDPDADVMGKLFGWLSPKGKGDDEKSK